MPLKTKTRQNEERLRLPASVYAYLGRSSSGFGTNGFAVPLAAASGTVSPFDTGGLVEHIRPVCDWEADDRQEFLGDYSWAHTDLAVRLADHPSDALGALGNYLDGHVPSVRGPHMLWSGREGEIWDHAVNTWPAWTWEIRSPSLPAGNDIVCWTCPSHVFEQIRMVAEASPADADWFAFLLGRYVAGGISQMIVSKRREQEAA
jgi:hypothetical protein